MLGFASAPQGGFDFYFGFFFDDPFKETISLQ